MRELYHMRARQCRATAAATEDLAERYKLERIAWEWDQLAALQADDDPAESNVIPYERMAQMRRKRERRAARMSGLRQSTP